MSTTLLVQMTGERMGETQPVFGELYIHSHTGCSPMSALPPAAVSLRLIFADLYMEGLTEVSTQSPDDQTQRIGSPLS